MTIKMWCALILPLFCHQLLLTPVNSFPHQHIQDNGIVESMNGLTTVPTELDDFENSDNSTTELLIELDQVLKSLNLSLINSTDTHAEGSNFIPSNLPISRSGTENLDEELYKIDDVTDLTKSFSENWNQLDSSSRTHILAQVLKLLLSIPSIKLSLVKPVLSGGETALGLATKAVSRVTEHVAKNLPVIAKTKADILRRLIVAFGDVAGTLLYIISQLFSSTGSAKLNLGNNVIPNGLDFIIQNKNGVTSILNSLIDAVTGIKQGVVDGVRAKGTLVGSVIQQGQQLATGIGEGLHGDRGNDFIATYGL